MDIEDVTRADDEDSRTVDVTWATETEVRQWFGREKLIISKTAVDFARMDSDQAPILYNHRTYGGAESVLGVVENVRIEGKKCKARLRFETHEQADIVYRGIQGGTRKQLSTGYRVLKYEVENPESDDPLHVIKRWQPFEVSVVATGADPNALVNRSERSDYFAPDKTLTRSLDGANNKEESEMAISKEVLQRAREAGQTELALKAVEEEWSEEALTRTLDTLENQPDPEPEKKPDPEPEPDGKRSDPEPEKKPDPEPEPTDEQKKVEDTRVTRIFEIGQEHGKVQDAAQAIQDGESIEAFQARLLKANKQPNEADPDNPYVIERVPIEPKDLQTFRIINLINHQLHGGMAESTEVGIAQEEAKVRGKQGLETRGLAVPDQVLGFDLAKNEAHRALVAGTDAAGGHTIDEELLAGSFIDILLENTAAMRLCTQLRDLQGDLIFPRQDARAVASWTAETVAAAEQNQSFDTVTMTPKHLRAYTVVSTQLLHQSSIDIEMFVRRDLARAVAKECDQSILNGTGSGDEPIGIDNITGINTVTSIDFPDPPTDTSRATYFDAVLEAEEKLADANALSGRLAWVTEPGVRKEFRRVAELGTGTSRPIWYRNMVCDYPAHVTTQCVDDTLYFANWMEFLIGHWGGVDILVNPYSLDTTAQVRINIYKMLDFADRHAVSFCKVS